jgi:outer membrane protein
MKRSFFIALIVLSSSALSVAAQTPSASTAAAPDGPPKIAVIAFQAAVGQTNEFQRNYADLQKKFDPQRQKIKTEGDKLSDSERASRAKAIDDKKKQLQRTGEDAQNDFQQEMQQTFGDVANKVGDLLTTYAKDHGYTLVLDGGEQEAAVVLFHTPSTDITKAIIDAYNAKSGVPAPVQLPSAPTPKGPSAN